MKLNYKNQESYLLEFIELHKIYISVIYERGNWYYVLYQLPSDEDIKFAESGKCQDGDLWLDSQQLTTTENQDGFSSYSEALKEGIIHANTLLDETS